MNTGKLYERLHSKERVIGVRKGVGGIVIHV